jgi:hypothetical protein
MWNHRLPIEIVGTAGLDAATPEAHAFLLAMAPKREGIYPRPSERPRQQRGSSQKGMPVKQNRSSAARERQERGAATVILPDGLPVVHRDLIINLANRARMPAIYPFRTFAVSGGLLSWGTNFSEVYRQAAT